MKIKNSLIKPIKKSIITWIVGGIVLLIVWCCDIKKILLYIPGIRNFVLNLNFITSIFTNYYTVIIGALFLVVILYLRKYADVKVPSISIAGIEFNLKNIDRIVKANLTNYFVTKRSLFKIDILKDNFDDVFESYHNTYEFIRLQMSYYENVAKTDNTIYKEIQKLNSEELVDLETIAKVLGFGGVPLVDTLISPKGYRILFKIPRIPTNVIENLIKHFNKLKYVIAATKDELDQVEGIGEARATAIRSGLKRIKEQIYLKKEI